MSIKSLASVHEKYIISLEHKLEPVPAVAVVLTIPGENNTYVRKVTTLFEAGDTVEEAEEKAINKAVSMLLGNEGTERLQGFDMFDLSVKEITAKTGALFRANIVVFKDKAPYRQVSSIASSEAVAIKNAVSKVMGE